MLPREAKIALAHQGQVDELLDLYTTVQSFSPTELSEQLEGERNRLRNWRARVAIIGQVKAGKSTFLSALVGKPGFLPTEVNPWTSVVTNIHVGHPDDPDDGGEFHFFDEGAWDRIIHGDKKTRELAENLLPGFRSEVLAEQVKKMQKQARERLGRYYDLLLGQSHKYETITAETLERYVCAGPPDPQTMPSETLGRYSDITERADIYLPAGLFAAPVIISDTPGVNDPFLVRDEYTCRSLNEAEVFVILLSAHQAMTEVDLALIQMLSANQANHVIVFINRIDELADFDLETPKVIADVKARIASVISDQSVSVIAGSAHWAELALDPSADITSIQVMTNRPDAKAYLAQRGESPPADPRDQIFQLSGLHDVCNALSGAIDDGIGLTQRMTAVSNLQANIRACRTVLYTLRETAQNSDAPTKEPTTLSEAIRSSLDSRSEAAQALNMEMAAAIGAGAREIDDAVSASATSIRSDLNARLQTFVGAQHVNLMQATKRAMVNSVFDFNLLDLRKVLEEETVLRYVDAREALDEQLSSIASAAEDALRPLLGKYEHSDALTNLPHDLVTPVFPNSSRVFSMELTSPTGWKFWRDTRLTADEGAQKLRQLIEAETMPSLENLVDLSEQALSARAAKAIERISGLITAMLNAISSQSDAIGDVDAKLAEIAEAEAALARIHKNLLSRQTREPRFRTAS